MSTPLSEVISYLSFDGTIQQGESYETIKVLLQEFGSMSVVLNPSANVSLSIQFSNDGLNFDTNNNYSVGSGGQTITSVILGKWARLRVTNTVKENVSVRLSTFCQVIPIAIQSQLESEGDVFPSVNIDNQTSSLFGDLRVAQRETIRYYSFQYYTQNGGVLVGPDRDLIQDSYGGANFIDSPGSVNGGTIGLTNIYNSASGGSTSIKGDDVSITAGNSIWANISCGFYDRGYDLKNAEGIPDDGFDQSMVGIGYIDEGTGKPLDGIYIGYPDSIPGSPIVDEFCLIVYTNSQETVITKSQWIYDSLDSNGSSGILLDPTKLSTWRIRTATSCSVYLEYHDPRDNLFIPCHRLQVENVFSTIQLSNPSLAFNLYTERTTTSSGELTTSRGCGPYCSRAALGFEAGIDKFVKQQTYSVFNSTNLVANIPKEILSIRCGPDLNGVLNRSNVRIDDIYLTHSNGSSAGKVDIIKNGSFNNPTWSYVDPIRDCVQTDVGTLFIGTGYNIKGVLLSPNTTENPNLSKVDNELSRFETLSIVATSAADVTGFGVVINYTLLI